MVSKGKQYHKPNRQHIFLLQHILVKIISIFQQRFATPPLPPFICSSLQAINHCGYYNLSINYCIKILF